LTCDACISPVQSVGLDKDLTPAFTGQALSDEDGPTPQIANVDEIRICDHA